MSDFPVLITAFAANDLPHVRVEAEKLEESLANHSLIKFVKIEDVDVVTLVNTVLDHHRNLYFFHFSGHADQKKMIMDESRELDKIRFSRILMPREQHKLQWAFLNGCFSYGHVGMLTAKGLKAVIATNVGVEDKDSSKLASIFYKCFFSQGFTLKEAFEYAESIITGRNAHTVMVNPGEIDENQPMPASWTLFVNAKFKEVLDWTLEDFITKGLQTTEAAKGSESEGSKSNHMQLEGGSIGLQDVKDSTIDINTGTKQIAEKMYNIKDIKKADFS